MIGVGEAGREAVMPLDRNTGWIDELASKLQQAGGGGSSGAYDRPIEITVNLGSTRVHQEIIRGINNEIRRSGGKSVIMV